MKLKNHAEGCVTCRNFAVAIVVSEWRFKKLVWIEFLIAIFDKKFKMLF
jgi:hypothetical protein